MIAIKIIIDTILSKMLCLSKPKLDFMPICLQLYLSILGRINFLQLSRHSRAYVESTYRNQFEAYFDFSSFNTELVLGQGSGHYILALDMTYMSKSGWATAGIGKYWSGSSGRAEWGLEAGILAIIDIDNHTAFSLDAVQTPSKLERENLGISYLDYCVSVILWNQANIKRLSNYLAVDAYFTKKEFILPLLAQTDLQVVGRLREDANLRYLYQGEKKSGRGRPKQYAGKVDWKNLDLNEWTLSEQNEAFTAYEALVYAVFLKRNIKVVYVIYQGKKGKEINKIYFSTDTNLAAKTLKQYYQARFQEEFLIRDAKQFTGLQDCQARSTNKIEFHWNMALTAVNLAKVSHWLAIPKNERKSFSMNDIKIYYHNQLIIQEIFQILPNGNELMKNNPQIKALYKFGSIYN